MIIEELAKKYANVIQGFTLAKYFEAALPVYKMEVNFTLQKEKGLSVLQEFILKFVRENIDSTDNMCRFLGLNDSVVYNCIAELQTLDLLAVDIYKSKLRITSMGLSALEKAALIIPEDVSYPVYMDGLIGNIFIDNRKFYNRKEIRNSEMVPIIAEIDTPKLSDISFENLKMAISKYSKENYYSKNILQGELLTVNKLEKVYLEYKKVSVLVYYNEKTDGIELRVFEKSTRRQDYETQILKMHNNNIHVLEFDKKSVIDSMNERPLLKSIPKEVITEAQEYTNKISEYNKQITVIQTQLLELKEQIQDSKSEEDKQSVTQRVLLLQKQVEKLENEKNHSDKILNTYDHRPLLIKALKESKEEVVIVSPWIKCASTNGEVLNLIEKAVERNTKVIIGYGISEKKDSDEWVIQKLIGIRDTKKNGHNLQLISLNNTHEKVLISDDNFMVITSFNWLSFKGDPNRGFRQETGIYTEAKDCINDMKHNLSERMLLKI